jgi:succinate dehydrogenase flavin-adding protein (antitoxin of CptAB toxin-antitoxin module)
LDQLFTGYLEKNYLTANSAEQQHFQQLLDLEDSELLQLFFTQQDSDQRGLNDLIEKIRHSTTLSD